MAKIKMTAIVADIRNKLNGTVFSKNRYGAYMRTKVTPVNPQSSFQQAARSILASLSSGWKSLTAAQRLGWNALAKTISFTDIFGDSKFLTGASLYVSLNTNLVKIGTAPNPAAPLPVGFPVVLADSLSATQSAGALTALDLTVSVTTIPAGFALAIYATPAVIPSISFVKNQFRFLGVSPAVVAGVADIEALFIARFGASASAGRRIFVRCALINTTTGEQGIPSEAIAVVA